MNTDPTKTPDNTGNERSSDLVESAASTTRRLAIAAGLAVTGVLAAVAAVVLTGDDDNAVTADAPVVTVAAPTTERPEPDPAQAPATDAPTTDVPTTDAPTTDVPTTDVPTTDVPTTDVPTTDVPAVDVPTTDVPAVAEQVPESPAPKPASDEEEATETPAPTPSPSPAPAPEVDTAPVDDAASDGPAGTPADDPVRPAEEIVIGQNDDGTDIIMVFEISQACATTHHQQFGDQPSSIRWVFDAPGLDDGTEVVVPFTADGSVRRITTVENHRIVAEQGIDSYGAYEFPPVVWDEADGVTNTVDADGIHTVDDQEGEPSKTCVS